MKRIIAIMLILAIMFSLVACGGSGMKRAAKEISEIIGTKFTEQDVKDAIKGLEALSGEKKTPADAVKFYKELYNWKK